MPLKVSVKCFGIMGEGKSPFSRKDGFFLVEIIEVGPQLLVGRNKSNTLAKRRMGEK